MPGVKPLSSGSLLPLALLDIVLTSGGIFDNSNPVPENSEAGTVGSMKITFESCSNGTIEYEMPDLGLSGEIPIQRIVNDNVALCEVLSSPEVTSKR